MRKHCSNCVLLLQALLLPISPPTILEELPVRMTLSRVGRANVQLVIIGTLRRLTSRRTEVEANPTGQDIYVEDIRQRLLDGSGQRISVISIFGMGGLGKTTLVKRIYNDKEVTSHFNVRAWLTISQNFLRKDLLRSLIDQLNLKKNGEKELNEDEMKSRLEDHLSENNFILVLDDIWEISSLMYLQAIIPQEAKGISVLLTTRIKNIATDWNRCSQVIEMQPLEDEDSWLLFCRQVFTDANCPEDFLEFKDEVIKRCKGLPLSIKVLGGLLRRRNDAHYWRKVLDRVSVNTSPGENELQHGILALSYDHLPRHLKACFLYVAGYPEDYKIQAVELTRMWIAEGFITQQKGYSLEDLAEMYLEELIQRSLIQLVERDEVWQLEVIQVHDLVLDMARKEAGEIDFLHQSLPVESSVPVRRLSLCDNDDIHRHFNCTHNYPVPKLHSLRVFNKGSRREVPSTYNFMFDAAKFLRVLSFRGVVFPNGKCPAAVGNMIQLRYLSFAGTNVEELPNNILNLRNLQTLDIDNTFVNQLPDNFWEIASLRHVVGILEHLQIDPAPKTDANKFTNLQTLIGKPNYRWILMGGLGKLTNIRTLKLYSVHTTTVDQDNKDLWKLEEKLIDAIENLKHLTYLRLVREVASIKVLTARNTSLRHVFLHGRCNSQIVPNSCLVNLKSLVLYELYLTEHQMEMVGLLPNLKSLHILTELELTKLVFEDGCFSSLQELELVSCTKLKSWEANGDWSTKMLQRVKIQRCSSLTVLPKELQVKEIKLEGTEEQIESWASWTKSNCIGNSELVVWKPDYRYR